MCLDSHWQKRFFSSAHLRPIRRGLHGKVKQRFLSFGIGFVPRACPTILGGAAVLYKSSKYLDYELKISCHLSSQFLLLWGLPGERSKQATVKTNWPSKRCHSDGMNMGIQCKQQWIFHGKLQLDLRQSCAGVWASDSAAKGWEFHSNPRLVWGK